MNTQLYGDELSKWFEDILGNDIVFTLCDDLVYWKNGTSTLECKGLRKNFQEPKIK